MEKDWATGEERKAKIENENAKSPIVNRKSTIPDGQMAPSTQLRIRAPCPVSRIPCPESRPLSRCPEIRGREHGNEFEINEVFPMNRPASQQLRIRCFHNLKTARPTRFHPARVVDDAIREHPAAMFEAFSDQPRATRLEVFDDHEEHAPESIPDWAHMKPVCEARHERLTGSPLRVEVTPHPHDLQNLGTPPSSVGHPLPWERAVILICRPLAGREGWNFDLPSSRSGEGWNLHLHRGLAQSADRRLHIRNAKKYSPFKAGMLLKTKLACH